ncbi:TetR/AcrR family transcriptional regulator [Shewanella sp. Isolate13]|uniref:TetR/AcrR family transcriptional regulator n=1 Tax=Shewanella sp. Isolate13 TaxID=2908531 RepID=UPI001EFE729F|nr:TetR/AcrR family transcriptional regulator [Shewanella sp. Isolate13]MCG9730411.1 TetR/AcrR family transcriptional regulator [Shewanella sp. Isolate13]
MRPSTLKKQQKIIDVATQLFFEQGYAETSLDQIIEVCGGSKQTLYSYFGCKRGILIQVVTRCTEQVGSVFQFYAEADLTEQLNQFGYEYLKALCSKQIIDIYRIIVTESRRDKELVDFFLSRGPHRFYQLLSDYLQVQATQGKLNIENPAQASSQLIGLLRGDYYQDVVLGLGVPSEEEIKQYSSQAIKIFLQGCKA